MFNIIFMRKIVLFFVVIVMLVMSGCQRHPKDECEDILTHVWLLPKTLNQYLPYEVGQHLTFTNEMPDELGDTVIYEIVDVRLLEYDSAYVTSSYNPCYPTGLLPDYDVRLIRISEQTGDKTPKQILLLFGGSAGGSNGQVVNVEFGMLSDFENHQSGLNSKNYQGNVSEMGDTIRLDQYGDPYVDYAEIHKDKGLVGFSSHRDGIVSWMLLE